MLCYGSESILLSESVRLAPHSSPWGLELFFRHRISHMALAIAFAFAVSNPVLAQTNGEHASDYSHSAQSNSPADSAPRPPPIIAPVSQEQPHRLDHQPQSPTTPKDHLFGLNAEGWTAAFTAILTLATGGLWWETRRTIAHARRSAEHQLRAYVFVHDIQMEMTANKAPKPTGRVSFDYRNSGQTPAKDVRIAAHVIRIPRGNQFDFRQWGEFKTMGAIGPGDERGDDMFPLDWGDQYDPRIITEDGSWEIHLFGRIEYADEFSNNRLTEFHSYIGGDAGWDETLHTYKEGNDYA